MRLAIVTGTIGMHRNFCQVTLLVLYGRPEADVKAPQVLRCTAHPPMYRVALIKYMRVTCATQVLVLMCSKHRTPCYLLPPCGEPLPLRTLRQEQSTPHNPTNPYNSTIVSKILHQRQWNHLLLAFLPSRNLSPRGMSEYLHLPVIREERTKLSHSLPSASWLRTWRYMTRCARWRTSRISSNVARRPSKPSVISQAYRRRMSSRTLMRSFGRNVSSSSA